MEYLNPPNLGGEFLDDAIRFSDLAGVLVPGRLDQRGNARVLRYPWIDLAQNVVDATSESDRCELLWIGGLLDDLATSRLTTSLAARISEEDDIVLFAADDPSVAVPVERDQSDPASSELAQAIAAMNGYVHEQECVRLEHADVEARRLLDSAGFAHWNIEWRQETEDGQRCASFVVDSENETIQLVPTAPPARSTRKWWPASFAVGDPDVAVHLTRRRTPPGASDGSLRSGHER